MSRNLSVDVKGGYLMTIKSFVCTNFSEIEHRSSAGSGRRYYGHGCDRSKDVFMHGSDTKTLFKYLKRIFQFAIFETTFRYRICPLSISIERKAAMVASRVHGFAQMASLHACQHLQKISFHRYQKLSCKPRCKNWKSGIYYYPIIT